VTYNSESALLALLGANFDGVGNTSKVLGPNFFADTFNLTFTSANAAGFDVFAGPVAGNVAIGVFSPANAPLGSFTVFAPIGGTFFGVISDSGPIGRINVASQAAIPGELIDNLTFGLTVPEPSGLVLFSAVLVIIGVLPRQPRVNRHES